ncbi:MAG: 30S ribosomal protein S3ae [Promethearchaeota archaeon]
MSRTSSRRRGKSTKGKSVDRWALKKFYNIVSPENIGSGQKIGETIADDPDKLHGRTIEVPLSDITQDYSKIHFKLKFQVNGVIGDTATTQFRGHSFANDYLRFLVRRRRTRIDGVFDVRTTDEQLIRVTVTAFTTHRAKTSQKYAIRAIMKKVVNKKAQELSFKEFIDEIIYGKLGSEVYSECKKIFPLKRVEVQKSKVLSRLTIKTNQNQ